MECVTKTDDTGVLATYTASANTRTVYGLLWNVPLAVEGMHIVYANRTNTAIAGVTKGNGFVVRSGKGTLMMSLPDSGALSVHTMTGAEVCRQKAARGLLALRVPADAYIVRFKDSAYKVLVRE